MWAEAPRQIRKYRFTVFAVGRSNKASFQSWVQTMLAHQPCSSLVIDRKAFLTKLSRHSTISITWESVSQCVQSIKQPAVQHVCSALTRLVVERRARQPHHFAPRADANGPRPLINDARTDDGATQGARFE